MNPDGNALSLLEDFKKENGFMKLNEDQQKTFKWTKIACAVIMLITTILAFIAVIGFPDSFELKLYAFDDYREGADQAEDGYPELASSEVGITRIGLIVAFISLLATIAYAISACAHNTEVEQMNSGSNPFVWIFQLIWVGPFFLVIYFVSGASKVFALTFVSLVALYWLVLFWADDLVTSNRHKADVRASSQSTYGWVFFAFIVFSYLVVLIVAGIYMFFTFSAANAPHGILLAIPITLLILYLGIPIGYAVNRADRISQYQRDMFLYIYSGFLIVVATWLSLLIFVYDGIDPVHPDHAEEPIAAAAAAAAVTI